MWFQFQAQTDSCLRRFLRGFDDVDEAYTALIKYINWREDYGVNCLSRGDDDIEEQIALDKAEVLEFPDHRGRWAPILYLSGVVCLFKVSFTASFLC